MSDRQAQQDARDAEFGETPFGATSICPLYLECAIFPVRYATDEASSEREEAQQGPHPLAEAWQQHGYPDLQTRSYCLRQLRDGWLYVWDEIDRTFHEYRIEEHQFTRIPWREDVNETRPDEREGDGESKPYLLYPCRSRIWLAYSPAQWTWRICEHIRSNVDARRRFMRPLNIRSAIVDPEHTAHVGPLNELGQHLADITPQGAASDFDSTTVMTRELTQEEREGKDETEYVTLGHKPEIDQNAVLAQVPDKDQALFVALDDPLGIVNDLTMNLLGVEMAYEQFEDEAGHRLNTALVVQRLCGFDDNDLPDAVRNDSVKRRRAIELLGLHYQLRQSDELSTAINRGSPFDGTIRANASANSRQAQLAAYEAELAELGIDPRDGDDYREWKAKAVWRNDVDYEGALAFIDARQPEQEHLQAHCQRCREDLTTWLDRLPTSAQALCFDGCNVFQTQALIEFTHMVSQALGASEEGQQWLTERARRRDNLVGLALFNFSPELERALTEVARNFIETGEADGLEVSEATSYASRANEIKTLLDLEGVRNSKVFQALAPHVRSFLDTLATAVQGPARLAWEGLAYQLLPAVGAGGAMVTTERLAQGLSQTMQAAFMHPGNAARDTQLVRDGDYDARHHRWRRDVVRLQNRLRGLRATLSRPAAPHDRAAQIRDLNSQQREIDELMTREPKRFVARQSGSPGGPAETLGFDELREQQRLKLQAGAAATRARIQSWMSRYGGGLPLLVAGLNLLNVGATLETIEREDMVDNARQSLISSLGYTTSAVMALWVVPYWQKHASLMAPIESVPTKLAKAGIRSWDGAKNTAFARTAAKLTTRVAGMAIFGAIGAGMETLQIRGQFVSATSIEERVALFAKGVSTLAMGAVSVAQLFGATAGYLWSFAWIMAPWAVWTLAIAGVIYLFASHFASYYHREGIRLWLYRSGWGASPRWADDDEGRASEWRALLETLYQPAVRLEPVTRLGYQGRSPVNVHQGFWLKIALPSMLAGESIKLSQNASQGFWAPASGIEERTRRSPDELPVSAGYGPQEMRVWQAWLPAEVQAPDMLFTLSVDYPETLLSSPHSADYVFHKSHANEGGFSLEPRESTAVCLPFGRCFSLAVPA